MARTIFPEPPPAHPAPSRSRGVTPPPPRIIQAVKWLEQFSQSILRNTRPRVAHAKHNLSTAGPLLARQLNLDRRPLLRIADRIAHHILYRAVQQRIVPPHTPVALGDYRVNMAMSLLRFKLRILGNAGH